MFFAFLLAAALISPSAFAAEANTTAPRVLRVTPQGEDAPPGRRIVVQFDRPVIALGDDSAQTDVTPRIETDPPLPCRTRWLNRSALGCILDEAHALRHATKYKVNVTVQSDTSPKNKDTGNTETFSFTTLRPDVEYAEPPRWDTPDVPFFPVTFNQPVTAASAANALRVVGKIKPTFELRAEKDPEDPAPAEKTADGEESRARWLVSPKRPLPENTTFSLRVEPGLISSRGPEKGAASRELTTFAAYPSPKLLGIKCYANEDPANQIFITPGQKQPRSCNPLGGLGLVFSSPTDAAAVDAGALFTPPMPAPKPELSAQNQPDLPVTGTPAPGENFTVWITCAPKAGATYTLRPEAASAIKDKFGRPQAPFPKLSIRIDRRKPNIELPYRDAVLEKQTDSEAPLYVNNIREAILTYTKVTPLGAASGLTLKQTPAVVPDIQFAVPLGIRKALEGQSGALYGTISTIPPTEKPEQSRRIFAQVTPWQLHAKLGHFSGLLMATDTSTGEPVAGAKVTIYRDKLSSPGAPAANSILAVTETDKDGLATLPGMVTLDPQLKTYSAWEDADERIFIRADKIENATAEMALLPVSDSFLIDPYRSSGESVYYTDTARYGHIKAWGVTAQGLHRPGETIKYKIYVRDQNNVTLTPAPREGYRLRIIDPKGEIVFDNREVTLDDFGAFSGEYKLPSYASAGRYSFKLTALFPPEPGKSTAFCSESDADTLSEQALAQAMKDGSPVVATELPEDLLRFPLDVPVADVAPSQFKVTTQTNGSRYMPGDKAQTVTVAALHAGGAYGGASARLTATLESAPFMTRSPSLAGFTFDSLTGEASLLELFRGTGKTDAKGQYRASFDVPASPISFGRIMFESSVQDDRGRSSSARAFADYAASDRFAGLRPESWMLQAEKPSSVFYAAADAEGAIAPGVPVETNVEYLEVKSARVKSAGSAYVTETTETPVPVQRCSAITEDKPSVCAFTPPSPGTYRVTVKVTDSKGRAHITQTRLYAAGKGEQVWSGGDDYSLEIIPEKASYRPGDTARFFIKNPYPGAEALITTERYGVISRFARKLEGAAPVIELPVTPDHLPGFYLSVTVFSPRAGKASAAPEAGKPDLGKPTFRMGYLTVPVEDPYKRLTTTAKTDRESYKPREEVKLSLHASPLHPSGTPEPISFAVAVVDEAALDLTKEGASRYDPYTGFYVPEGLDVRNYSLLTRLTGRQRFETKGANAGGDGGGTPRSLFDSVAYWNPAVKADANGDAVLSFPLPDNLTGWRVLALAVTPGDRMGLGQTEIKTRLPTELRAMVPDRVRAGDVFTAAFSVSNRTDLSRNLRTSVSAEGALAAPVRDEKTLKTEAFGRSVVRVQAKASGTADGADGTVTFTAEAGDGEDKDALLRSVTVSARTSRLYAAEHGAIPPSGLSLPVAAPASESGTAEATVTLSPSLLGGLAPAFSYLERYPHRCWEQRLSRAYGASAYTALRGALPADYVWNEATDLPQETASRVGSFQTSDGGMAYFTPEEGRGDPFLSAYTAEVFFKLKSEGVAVPAEAEKQLLAYLENYLRQDGSGTENERTAEARANVLAALSAYGKVTRDDLERLRPGLRQLHTSGKIAFLEAAARTQDGDAAAAQALKLLTANADRSGGGLALARRSDESASYFSPMDSPARNQCKLLSVVTLLSERKAFAEEIKALPEALARSALASRGKDGAWPDTQSNGVCVQALSEYTAKFETDSPSLTVTATIDGAPAGKLSFTSRSQAPVALHLPLKGTGPQRLTVTREGKGSLYYTASVNYVPSGNQYDKPRDAGMSVNRRYLVKRQDKWVPLKEDEALTEGETVRVVLDVETPSERPFAALTDNVPGGLEPIDTEAATASLTDTTAGEEAVSADEAEFWDTSYGGFYHTEISQGTARFYADSLPAGKTSVSYTAQAVSAGVYLAPSARAEEMYRPDIFGESDSRSIRIEAREAEPTAPPAKTQEEEKEGEKK